MSDPRPGLIGQRLESVGETIAVSSGKGGVGKSMVASTLALDLAEKGHSVGLLDLDFTSPATHVILGIEGLFPEEDYGIIPPLAHGFRYMSITHFALDKPAPLRGADVSDAIIELLAITLWGDLDYLIIDMPPGLGDATLDVIRFVEGIKEAPGTSDRCRGEHGEGALRLCQAQCAGRWGPVSGGDRLR
jgi:ATP-binding protein involved in chromosome partitioning